ncbi:EspA/EspE family type VII secretion system effector [Mycobacterium sp. SP-6446]|uniref:EspA/EspE family type VII secretion system effector n=1 Tax=Mycobacterium sp. SP-6446 TaxID=1834162 RepID=UPI00096EBF16|nr:EspA/EspE family type VII secretion system effector [Mycobacterium sp. SP-6446]OMC15307.1 hypothetical protein A5736_01620 [Mycobacterium sp. SP-6446]
MSIFSVAARSLASLAGIGQQFAGAGGAGLGLSPFTGGEFSAESIAGSVTSGSGDLGALGANLFTQDIVKNIGKNMNIREKSLFERRTSGKGARTYGQALSIILWTITIVEVLELTAGFGPPAEGGDLKGGSQQFSTLSEQLKSALPTDGWQGSGSQGYADLNTALQDVAQSMADLDSKLARLVENQAEWVNHMRLGLGILKDALFAAYVIEVALMLGVPAPIGPTAAKIYSIAAAAIGMTAAAGMIGNLCYWSFDNAKQANSLASQYEALIPATAQEGSLAEANVAAAAQSSVSSFAAISSSMSGMSALPDVAAVAAPASAATGSEDERAPLSAKMSAAETAVGEAPHTPETPDKTPSTPPVTMPTLAQLSAMSGQASKLSGQLSQHSQLVNQAMGQIQQLAQMGQQGQGAAAPAEEASSEEAALAGDVEGAGVGSNAAGAERAPVEAAVGGAEWARQPSPAGRIV